MRHWNANIVAFVFKDIFGNIDELASFLRDSFTLICLSKISETKALVFFLSLFTFRVCYACSKYPNLWTSGLPGCAAS